MADLKITQPDKTRSEALVTFPDGSRALVSSGVASGAKDAIGTLDISYTYGPHAGSTVHLTFGFDKEGRPKDGAITPTVEGTPPSARTYATHAAELLRNPAYLAIVGKNGTYELGKSGSAIAAQIAERYKVAPAQVNPAAAPKL